MVASLERRNPCLTRERGRLITTGSQSRRLLPALKGKRVALRRCVALLATVAACALAPSSAIGVVPSDLHVTTVVTVIVRGLPGRAQSAERAVLRLDGAVLRRVPLINGLIARLPASSVRALEHRRSIVSVTVDRPVGLMSDSAATDDGNSTSSDPTATDPAPASDPSPASDPQPSTDPGSGGASPPGSSDSGSSSGSSDSGSSSGSSDSGSSSGSSDSGSSSGSSDSSGTGDSSSSGSGDSGSSTDPPPDDASNTEPAADDPPWQPAEDGGVPLDAGGELNDWYLGPTAVGAPDVWQSGITGAGVDVALIDSGVVPVAGLDGPGKIVYGPDLSLESQSPDLFNLDTFGHGTHMAGIIAGTATTPAGAIGVAPGARIVSIKVANAQGLVDVSQVIAAIDWVVQYRNANGLHIRVLNLSFGTDSEQSYRVDPLAFAVEQAWRHGIVVVAAAGNSGFGSPRLNDPAYDPSVIAVGASDPDGTYDLSDDTIADWSSRGGDGRSPDIYVPGTRILSLRDPGSAIDTGHPEGRVGTDFFRGSGTSEATAVVSGMAALLLQRYPNLRPDDVKRLLMALGPSGVMHRSLGALFSRSPSRWTRLAGSTWSRALGTGSLELARGSEHLSDGDNVLTGERDIFGSPWPSTWPALSASATAWSADGYWNGNLWIGTWIAPPWSGGDWTSNLSSSRWSSGRWSGDDWSSSRWSASRWSSAVWSAQRWSSYSWGG